MKKRKPTLAATPGKSNHGLALAVDIAIDADGDPGYEWPPLGITGPALDWLIANAHRFGWSWEQHDEPWHLRYVAGDNIPAAVLAFERTGGVTPQPTQRNPPTPTGQPTIKIDATG